VTVNQFVNVYAPIVSIFTVLSAELVKRYTGSAFEYSLKFTKNNRKLLSLIEYHIKLYPAYWKTQVYKRHQHIASVL
jgi:hypothetical protein